jgi:hypothetical protein
MRQIVHAAIATALLAIASQANAHAYADVSFAGMNLSGAGSGTSFDVFYFGQALPSGTSFTESFPYTVTLHADGEPADRAWNFCLPLPGSDCGPPATGQEQVEFEFGFEQTPEASPFTSYQFSGLPTDPMVEDAGTLTYSGTFSITETIAPFGTFQDLDYLVVWGATWIDSNDTIPGVPEPAAATLMLLGLGVLCARRAGRC